MRAALLAAAVVLTAVTTAACDTADEVRSGVEEAASSAASIGAGAREACRASEDELKTLGDLADRLAAEPDLRTELAPQVRQTVDQLATEVGSRAELQPVVIAARELASAVGEANRDTVELAARQAATAIRSTQAGCRLAG
jgi:predicted small secreted protein